MNVDRLRAVQAEEREADSLRPLPDAFYREVADYIDGLREERASVAEAADDPFGHEDVRRLTDEIETAEEVVEALYERRVGKLVKRASLAAAGMPVDEEGLTTEEAELFADLVAQIEAHREAVFATFGPSGGSSPSTGGSADSAKSHPEDAEPRPSGNDGSGGTDAGSENRPSPSEPAEEDATPPPKPEPDEALETDGDAGDEASGADESDTDDGPAGSTDGGDLGRVTLRITRDVGEVFGVDERVYDLAAEDVVTLPAPNAEPLVERDAAERID